MKMALESVAIDVSTDLNEITTGHSLLKSPLSDYRPCEVLLAKLVVLVGEEAASQNVVAIEFLEPAPYFWYIDFRCNS
jgi:hypothetical protein